MFKALVQLIREWYGIEGPIPLHAPVFGSRERELVLDTIDSTFVSSMGEYVGQFERQVVEYTGSKYAVAMVNGTAALQLALELAGVEPGDEVITQPLTFVATPNAIVHAGASPVFVDVDRDTLGMSPHALDVFLKENVRLKAGQPWNKNTGRRIGGLVPMHTLGHPCRIRALCELAGEWRIPLVEDAAEALGSWSAGQHCGTFGKLGVLSFNGNKTITSGGGGMILTQDEVLARKGKHLTTTAKLSRGWDFFHDQVGYNFRLPNLNAALACAQMERLSQILDEKRALAQAYARYFENEKWADFLKEPENTKSNYWLCSIALSDETLKEAFLAFTNHENIMTRPFWELMTKLPMYETHFSGPLDNAEWLAKRVVSLPSSVRNYSC